MKRDESRKARAAVTALLCATLFACNGQTLSDRRIADFEATQQDFDAIARVAFKTIESKGPVETILVGRGLDPRALVALRHVHPVVTAPPGAPGRLPAGVFRVDDFTIEASAATLEGRLGPATGITTAAGMPDCGLGFAVSFGLESGDWVSHAYKTTTCAESRHWTPLDDAAPKP